MRLLRALPDRYQRLARELLAFGFAGVVNTAFGFLLFNLLFSSMGSLWANAVSTAGGTATSFVLNRYITYRHRPRRSLRQELPLFVVVNLIGLGIQQGIMALAKVTFNLQSTDRLEYNLVRVVSVAIGTVFLLLCYRYLVFRKDRTGVAEDLAIEIGMPLPPVAPAPDAARSVARSRTGCAASTVRRSTARRSTAARRSRPRSSTAARRSTADRQWRDRQRRRRQRQRASQRCSAPQCRGDRLVERRPQPDGVARHVPRAHHAARDRTADRDRTAGCEIGRPAEVALSPELELDELLPIESAPDASGHFRP